MTRKTALAFFLVIQSICAAHPPLPDTVLHPQNAPEAWNVLRLATENAAQLLRERRLGEIADQISLCSPALRTLTPAHPEGPSAHLAEQIVKASLAVGSTAQAAQAADEKTTTRALDDLRADLHEMAGSFDPATTQAEIYFCPMHPECLSSDHTVHCPKCGMPLALRRIPYSFVYMPPGAPTIRLAVAASDPLVPGQPAKVTLHLARLDGSPTPPDDLLIVHTQPIHLLIIDPGLRDYHHEHPIPGPNPGDYTFTFTPATDSPYRIFADIVPAATGIQEYPFIDLPGKSPSSSPPAEPDHLSAAVSNIHFQLTIGELSAPKLSAQKTSHLRLTISDPEGAPATHLEPFMNAFAHLVGLYADESTVVHLHPIGSEILNPSARGGPTLDFLFYPPKPGFLRLFCQIQVEGKIITTPFDVNIAP